MFPPSKWMPPRPSVSLLRKGKGIKLTPACACWGAAFVLSSPARASVVCPAHAEPPAVVSLIAVFFQNELKSRTVLLKIMPVLSFLNRAGLFLPRGKAVFFVFFFETRLIFCG